MNYANPRKPDVPEAAGRARRLLSDIKCGPKNFRGEIIPQMAANMLSVNKPVCYPHAQDGCLTL